MFASLKDAYALTDEGVRNVKIDTLWVTLANLIIMCGMGALYLAMEAFVRHYVGGDPLPGIAPFAIGLAAFAELFASKASAKRMQAIMNEPLATGSKEFEPHGHDVVFDHVAFSYGAGDDGRAGDAVLKDGVVAEQGSPAELKAADGEFARMLSLQRAASAWSL